MVFEKISESPSYWKFKATNQWYHRMNSLTKSEQKALPKGPGGMLQPQHAPLALMDCWILSRLAFATDLCNEGFEQYNFPQATTALYNFWLNDLCDVYLEYLKPVFSSGTSDTIATAKIVLWYCLNYALRLISPFMPYISEELYQRLPRQNEGAKIESICVQDYPKSLQYRNEALEKQVEFAQKICSGVRSTRSDYNLPNKTKIDLYIHIFNDSKLAQEIQDLNDVLMSSAYASKVTIVETDDKIPEGCAIVTISDKCSAHLMLKGIIDPGKEIEKLNKKQVAMKNQLQKLQKSMEIDNYASKVPIDVQAANSEKLAQLETEINRLMEAMSYLKTTIDPCFAQFLQ